MFGRNTDDDLTQQDNGQPTDQTVHDVSGSQPLPDDQSWQHPGQPIESPTSLNLPPEATSLLQPQPTHEPSHDLSMTVPTLSEHSAPQLPQTDTPIADDKPTTDYDLVDLSNDELIDIKQKALGQLNPLMEHLDQTPEEKFRTTMMMIQASDDQKLVPIAYEAAQSIKDEKARAQALLDIVNEINYFTQHHNS
jgi:hypothetical protein